jgi:hypothetical protein
MNPLQKPIGWIKANKRLFVTIALIVLAALIPLYGVLFPPEVDMAEHISVSKLLWEKMTGTSHLNLTISWFLGYRLFPILMLFVYSFRDLFRISPEYVPRIVAVTLIAMNAIIIVSILYRRVANKSWKALGLAGCFMLPAVTGMYSATWFLGFVNYTMAITLLIPAIFLTERFLRSGKWIDCIWLFLALALVYMAHPFAPVYWVLWYAGRGLASLLTHEIRFEWKKLAVLGAVFLPIVIYHWFWMPNTARDSPNFLLTQTPIISIHDWYYERFQRLLNGWYLKVDDVAESKFFAIVALGLIGISILLAFFVSQLANLRKMALANLFLVLTPSLLNDKLFPVPTATWLAYDRRWSLTVYAVCLPIAAAVIIQLATATISITKRLPSILLATLGIVATVAAANHLFVVRKGYVKFDKQARKWMAKVWVDETPVGIFLPRTPWHMDGTYLKHYMCLKEPDFLPTGSFFMTGYAADLFPVKLPPNFKAPPRVKKPPSAAPAFRAADPTSQ